VVIWLRSTASLMVLTSVFKNLNAKPNHLPFIDPVGQGQPTQCQESGGNNRVGYIDKQSAAIYMGVDKQQEKTQGRDMTCDESYLHQQILNSPLFELVTLLGLAGNPAERVMINGFRVRSKSGKVHRFWLRCTLNSDKS